MAPCLARTVGTAHSKRGAFGHRAVAQPSPPAGVRTWMASALTLGKLHAYTADSVSKERPLPEVAIEHPYVPPVASPARKSSHRIAFMQE